ncbi:MAG: efflux RND transporter permease subunit, partial [Spirochaetia bacterium]|nr:efflux RND transporter permease subunit [Spirochaetia bacterium]
MDSVNQSLETVGESFGGGYIEQNKTLITVRTAGRVANLENLENIPVRLSVSGRPIRIGQIAHVREGSLQRLGAATYRGEETVYGNVLMLLGANSREVAKDAERVVKTIDLPEDVELHQVYTRSYLVDATIKTVAKNLAEGAALVVMVLFLIMGNLRAAFLISLAIPFSMLFAAIGMKTFHISANLISLGAVDFGLLVDASIIIVESFLSDLEKHGTGKTLSLSDKIHHLMGSLRETAKPVAFGLLIIMLVYVPILSLQGIEGKMFKPMAETLLMALGASLLAALFLMPVLALLLIHPPKKAHVEPVIFRFLKKIYEPILHFGLKRKIWIGGASFLLLILSVIVFYRLGSDFIPALDEGDMVANLTKESRISLSESVEMQKRSDRIILGFSEVETVYSRNGQNESATDPMGVHLTDVFIILKKDHSKWPKIDGKRRTKAELFEAISKAIASNVPGQEIAEA